MKVLQLPTLEGIQPRRFGLVSWSPHVAFAFDLVADLRPRTLVELGTHSGESYFAFCQAAQENHAGVTCYAVDTWKGDPQAGFYPEEVYAEVYRHNQEFYADFSYLVRATFDDAVDKFADGSVDLIHFDGLHTYEAVKHDVERWRRKLSARGVALFHDIAARHDDFGAWKLWEEIAREGSSFAFRHGWGLGIWKPPGGEPTGSPLLETLFAANEREAENIRRYYLLATDALRLQKATAENQQLSERLKGAVIQAEGLRAESVRRDEALREAAAARDEAAREAAAARDEALREAAVTRDEALRVQAVLREEAAQREDLVRALQTDLTRLQVAEPLPALQIYHLREGIFDEEHSQSVPLAPGEWQRITLPLPTGWKGGSLRLDPGSGFGLAQIAGVRLYTTTLGEEVWKRYGGELKQAAVVTGSACGVPGARTLQVLCTGADPQVILPDIEACGFDEPLTLEIGICLRNDLPGLIQTFQKLASDMAEWTTVQSLNRELHASLAESREAHEAVRAEFIHTREELAARTLDLAQEREQWSASTQRWQAAEAHLATQVQRLQGALSENENARFDLEAERQELRGFQTAAGPRESAAEAEIAGLKGELHAVNVRLAEKDQLLGEISRRLVNEDARLIDACTRLEADHGRLRSMRRSISWRLTLPLRVIGRLLTGKSPTQKRVIPAPEPVAVAPEPERQDGGYRFQLDEPTHWNLPAQQVQVRGWCLPPEGSDAGLPRLRFRCGDQQTEAVCRLPRGDVQTAHGGASQWHRCGFETELSLPPGPSEVTVEAVDGESRSWPVARFSVRAPYSVFPKASESGDAANDYTAWINRYDSFTGEDRRRLRQQAQALPIQPLISVVMPVYNTPEQWLTKAIDSVRHQFYARWELCIADDCSPAPHVKEVLRRYEQLDPRIKVVYRTENGHISAASNSALELATGEFVALLDHDDELPPHALYAVAREINAHPEADLIYSDEDKIDEEGRRFSPYFKPDWNPDLFLGQNYLCHLSTYRTERLRALGGFRTGVEGSQDWDLGLRVTEHIPASRIRHLPLVLYHWRAITGSTARALEEKSYIVDSARQVLSDHCGRTALEASPTVVPGGHWRLRYLLSKPEPLITIIIPTRNQFPLLRQAVESVQHRSTYPHYEILIVDNHSDDPETVDYLERGDLAHTRVLRYPGRFNYSAINNFAVEHAKGELVCLLNNDVQVISPGWMEEMASQAMRPEIGAVGAMLYYPNDTIQHAGVILGIGGVAGHAFKNFPRGTDGSFNRARLVQNYTAVTAACLMIRKTTFQEVGGLEQEKLHVGFNDIDFCLKVHAAGYRNLWTPFAEFYHHESASRGLEDTPEKRRRFQQEVLYMQARWGDALHRDAAYNPNLSLDHEDFSYADPPRVRFE